MVSSPTRRIELSTQPSPARSSKTQPHLIHWSHTPSRECTFLDLKWLSAFVMSMFLPKLMSSSLYPTTSCPWGADEWSISPWCHGHLHQTLIKNYWALFHLHSRLYTLLWSHPWSAYQSSWALVSMPPSMLVNTALNPKRLVPTEFHSFSYPRLKAWQALLNLKQSPWTTCNFSSSCINPSPECQSVDSSIPFLKLLPMEEPLLKFGDSLISTSLEDALHDAMSGWNFSSFLNLPNYKFHECLFSLSVLDWKIPLILNSFLF